MWCLHPRSRPPMHSTSLDIGTRTATKRCSPRRSRHWLIRGLTRAGTLQGLLPPVRMHLGSAPRRDCPRPVQSSLWYLAWSTHCADTSGCLCRETNTSTQTYLRGQSHNAGQSRGRWRAMRIAAAIAPDNVGKRVVPLARTTCSGVPVYHVARLTRPRQADNGVLEGLGS